MTSSSTTPSTSLALSRQAFCCSSFLARRASAWSRSRAASSYSAFLTASSFWMDSFSIWSSRSARFGGLVMLRRRIRAPASSMASMALSGSARPVMYRSDSSTAATRAAVQDLHPVVGLVPVAEPLEDLDRVEFVRRIDRDRLEPAGERVVLLDVLAVLVERRRADALDLTAAQRRLEHVADASMAPSAPPAPDQRVQLVDEQDHVLGPADLVHDRFDPLLELPAVLRAGHHHGQVEHDDPAVVQDVGHVAADHHLGQPLDDGRLAHAGLAQEHRVVLLAAAEDLNHPLDLVLAADDRVELPLLGQLGQIAAKTVQGGRLALALVAAAPAAALLVL